MLVPYKAVYTLFSEYFVPKSLEGLITDCYSSFDESIETAERIEDYRYMHQMITQRSLNNEKYCFFWNYRDNLPTILVKDEDFTIDALSKLAFDQKSIIPDGRFIQLIESVVDNYNSDNPNDKLNLDDVKYAFEDCLALRKMHYTLDYEKIGRNDLCPCGNGKKYKKCHGSKVEA